MREKNFNALADYCNSNNIEAYCADAGLVIKGQWCWYIVPTGNGTVRSVKNPPISNPSGNGRAITSAELSRFE